MGKIGEEDKEGQTYSYIIIKSWGGNVQHRILVDYIVTWDSDRC